MAICGRSRIDVDVRLCCAEIMCQCIAQFFARCVRSMMGNSLQSTVGEGRVVSIAFRPAFIFVGVHPEVRLEPQIIPDGVPRIFVRRKYLLIIPGL